MKFPLLRNNNGGIVAIYVLTLCFFYLSMGLTLLAYHLGAFQDAMNIRDMSQAKALSQTAVQEARYFVMNTDTNWVGTSSEFVLNPEGKALGTYKYTVSKACNTYTLTGYGYVPSSTAFRKISDSLSIKLYNPSPYIIFSDGFESNDLSKWTGGTNNDAGTTWQTTNALKNNGSYAGLARRTSGGGTQVARLITPVFDLSGCDQVIIRFSIRSNSSAAYLRIFQDGGSGFGTSAVYEKLNPDSSSFSLPAERIILTSGLTNTTRFEFAVGLGATDQLLLDDVQISSPFDVFDSTVD